MYITNITSVVIYTRVCVTFHSFVVVCVTNNYCFFIVESSTHLVESNNKLQYHICHHDPTAVQGSPLEDDVTVELIKSLSSKNQCDEYVKNLFLDKLAR